jgi:hypothetical protein
MADILIDNATISSSLRALGYIPIAKEELLDVDQAALERLTEAMLLGDMVVVPDNYQQEFRQERKKILNLDCFRHLAVSDEVTGNLEVISTEMCKIWGDAYKNGARSGSLRRYFNFADSYFDYVWRGTKDSYWYLVNGYFGIGKENPLIRAFVQKDHGDFASKMFGDFSNELSHDLESNQRELSIAGPGRPTLFIDEHGELYSHKESEDEGPDDYDDSFWDNVTEEINVESCARDLKRLISTLAWLGKQYVWHQTLSAQLGAYYLSHPLRDFFAGEFLSVLEEKPEGAQYGGVIRHGLRQFRENTQRSLEAIGLGSSLVKINVPTFLPLAIRLSSSGKDFLDTVFQLRSEPACVELRAMLSEVEAALDEGNIKPYRRLHQEINKIGKNLLREHGIESTQIKLSPPWKLIGVTPAETGIDIPEEVFSLNFTLPYQLYKQFFVRRRYRVILKSIMEELAIIPTLAKYKDKLNSYSRSR